MKALARGRIRIRRRFAAPARMQTLLLAIALYLYWLVLSGMPDPFLLAVGAGGALGVAALAHRMEVADREGQPFHLAPAALGYWPWLGKEIFKSALEVSRIVLDPRLPVSPTLVRLRPQQKTTVGLVTHANSITLTPGTLSVEVEAEQFTVHAFTRDGAEALLAGDMNQRVARFEGSA